MSALKLAALMAASCLVHPLSRTTRLSSPLANTAQRAHANADDLIEADRRYAKSAEATDLITALSAMFDEKLIMGAGASFTHGREAAITALRGNPENPTSKISWVPIRVGTSSDGMHGFTQGYITTTRASGQTVLGKYLSYWTRESGEWKVAVYKRMGRPAGDVSLEVYPASTPTPGLPKGDAAAVARFDGELRAAESEFSNDGARIGMGPAFEKWGAPDALNLGFGPSWTFGSAAIAAAIAAQPRTEGSGVKWSSTEVLVAATGDLGVSIGFITRFGPGVPADAPGSPFFTIWKRATPSQPWRYVAE